MLTLQELKQIVDAPGQEQKIPTAKKLKVSGTVIVKRRLSEDAEIAVYKNGYVLYQIGSHTTVFLIHSCHEYLYESGNGTYSIDKQLFERESWYMRLVLEGEDRLNRNRESSEQAKLVSYSAVSEEWKVMEQEGDSTLDLLLTNETVEELLQLLTEQQRMVICQFFFCQKTQKQISKELGISAPAVSRILSRAIQRVRRKYSDSEMDTLNSLVKRNEGRASCVGRNQKRENVMYCEQ